MYKIKGWFPTPGEMSGSGFSIVLTPQWKDAVSKSGITQKEIDKMIQDYAVLILTNHGRAVDVHRIL